MTTNTALNRQGRWRHRAVALGVTVTLLGTLSACAPLVLGTAAQRRGQGWTLPSSMPRR
mgnify:CR=1 FL=1